MTTEEQRLLFDARVGEWEQEIARLCRRIAEAVEGKPYEFTYHPLAWRREHFLRIVSTLHAALGYALAAAEATQLPVGQAELEAQQQDEEEARIEALPWLPEPPADVRN